MQTIFEIGSYAVRSASMTNNDIVIELSAVGALRRPASVFPKSSFAESEIGINLLHRLAFYRRYNLYDAGDLQKQPDMVELFFKTFFSKHYANVMPEQVTMIEDATASSAHRSKFAEIFLETMQVPVYCSLPAQTLKLLAATRQVTGTVCDFGYEHSRICAIQNGIVIDHAKAAIGAKHIIEHMMQMLVDRGWSLNTYRDRDVYREMVEQFASFEEPTTDCETYISPDGYDMGLSTERTRACDVLFDEQQGVAVAFKDLQRSLKSSFDLMHNVLFTGGCAMIPGLPSRFARECKIQYQNMHCDNHLNSALHGAKLLRQTRPDLYSQFCITKAQYDEYGFQAIPERCPFSIQNCDTCEPTQLAWLQVQLTLIAPIPCFKIGKWKNVQFAFF